MPQGAILTTIGLSKLASATPLDQLTITNIAVGDGGGGYPTLLPSMTSLVNEVWRGTPSPPIRDVNNNSIIIFEVVIPPTQGGFTVREIGIFDSFGDMIAIGQTSVVEKPLPSALNSVELKARLYVQLSNATQVDLFFQTTPIISAGTVADENGGTVQESIDDWKGFTEALYAEAGIVDDGLPDTVSNSKRLTALHTLFDSTASNTNLGNTPTASDVTISSSTGTDATISAATTSLAGVMTAADKLSLGNKIDTVSNGAVAGEILASKPSSTEVQLKRLVAGTNVTLTSDANSVTINTTGGSGEVNTASNIGTGTGLFANKSGVDLQFKTLKTLGAATITSDTDSVTIDVTSAGGGDMLASVYDPQNKAADAFARANHTGTQAISTVAGLQIALDGKEDDGTAAVAVSTHVALADPHTQYALESSLATVATSGSYTDLTGKPLKWTETSQNIGSTTGAVSVVIASGAYIKATSTGNTTWTFDTTGLAANQVAAWTIMLTNGGSFTQTFTGAKWGDGTPPTTLGTGLSRLVFTYDGTDLIGVLSDKAIA